VSSLETVSKNLGKLVCKMHKTAPKQSVAPASAPAPAFSASTPAFSASTPAFSASTSVFSASTPAVDENQLLSYAATAANGPTTNWNVIEKKETQAPKPKHTLSNCQLVLTQEENQTAAGIDLLAICNAFNAVFAAKSMSNSVIASAKASKQENIVLFTTSSFNAQYLLEHIDIWKHPSTFKEALPIQSWFKVTIHGIPTFFCSNQNLAIAPTLPSELEAVLSPPVIRLDSTLR
jgi:hypothetical protein